MAIEVGAAYVTLLPSAKNFSNKVRQAIGSDVDRAGADAGRRMSDSMGRAAVPGAAKAGSTAGRQFGQSANKTADVEARRGGRSFGEKFGGAAKLALGAAMAGVAAGVGALVKGTIDNASRMQQSQGAVAAIFKTNAAQIEAAAKKSAQAVGLSANEYRELASVLGSSLKNKGITDFADQTQNLIKLGADMSAQFGGSTKEAVAALTSAMRGETDPIERYGVSLNAAAVQAEALRMGLVKGKGELTDQQKAMATLSIITKQTADAQGTFAREADTYAGKQQRAAASLENFKTRIGEMLLPMFSDLADSVNTKVIPAMEGMIDEFKDGQGPIAKTRDIIVDAFDKIKAALNWVMENQGWLAPLAAAILAVAGAYKLATIAAGAHAAIMGVVRAGSITAMAAQIGLNTAVLAFPGTWIVLALAAVVAAIVVLWNKNEGFRNAMIAAWNAIKAGLSAAWNWIRDNVFRPLGSFFTETLPRAATTFKVALSVAWESIKGTAKRAYDWVRTNVFDKFVGAFTWVSTKFGQFRDGLGKVWKALPNLLYKPVASVINSVFGKLAGVWNDIADKIGLGDKKLNVTLVPESLPGWFRGGYTGPGGDHEEAPGPVHRGEFVLRKKATDRLRRTRGVGLAGLYHMNRTGELPDSERPGPGMGGRTMPLTGRAPADSGIWRQLTAWITRNIPGARVTSAYRRTRTATGKISNHAYGRAVDVVGSGRLGLGAIFSRLKAAFPNALELIYSPAGAAQLWHGRPHFYTGSTRANHFDHVHLALASMSGAGKLDPGAALDALSMLGFVLPPGLAQIMSVASSGFQAVRNMLNGKFPKTQTWNSHLASGADKMRAQIESQVNQLSQSMDTMSSPDAATPAGSGVARWTSVVQTALRMLGQPLGLTSTVLRRMQQESGGNPRAINNWDINAKRGTPSKGLMQVIDPTFRSNMMPGYGNIWDPLSNVLASMRYAMRRYGSLSAAYNRRGGYWAGGLVEPQLYDRGGLLMPGFTLVSNQTGKPETVRTHDQERAIQRKLEASRPSTVFNINGIKHDSVGEFSDALNFALARDRVRNRY